jgi:hypothetical protein
MATSFPGTPNTESPQWDIALCWVGIPSSIAEVEGPRRNLSESILGVTAPFPSCDLNTPLYVHTIRPVWIVHGRQLIDGWQSPIRVSSEVQVAAIIVGLIPIHGFGTVMQCPSQAGRGVSPSTGLRLRRDVRNYHGSKQTDKLEKRKRYPIGSHHKLLSRPDWIAEKSGEKRVCLHGILLSAKLTAHNCSFCGFRPR